MNTDFQNKRRLVSLAALALLTPGCARVASYNKYQKVKEERTNRDLAQLRGLKTVTVLAPKTDREIGVTALPAFLMKDHVEAVLARKPDYIKVVYGAMANKTLSAELSDAVARRLENLGYTVNQVFSDELMNDSQTISEAPFDTDFTFAVSAPLLSIIIEPHAIGPDHYFFALGANSTLAHAKRVLSLGVRGRYSRDYYLITDQWELPEAVRDMLAKHVDAIANGFIAPLLTES